MLFNVLGVTYLAAQFEDAVPVKRFPRRKSISNFPLMNERVGAADQLMQS